MRPYAWPKLVPIVLFVACTAIEPGKPPVEGQEEFISATGNTGGTRNDTAAGAPGESADGGGARAIEEGDVFKLVGDRLYVLNAYRGLQVIDVSNPDAPRKLGTSPILGHPVEMYVRDGYAYVIVSDYFDYWQVADGQQRPFHGSQVRIVDVRNAEAPLVVGGIDVEGAIGDSRIVGDVLYVVANRWAWYSASGSTDVTDALVVTSIDLANPAAPRQVETLSFPGSSSQIHVSAERLYVAQPGGDWQHPSTDVTVVDIDDPAGDIAPLGSLSVDGGVDKRFQLDEYAGYFRIVTHWGGWGADGTQRLSVFTHPTTAGGSFAFVSQLDLPNTGGLFETRFDGNRAYLVTMVSVDPLEVIDLSDPANPVLTHALVIPGVLHQVVVRGDRLLALGTDERWSGVSASLFDVADPRAPSLLSRVHVGEGSAWSNANWDDKALRVLDDQGLMLVPFSAWDSSDNSYVNGFQLIEFTRQALRARGVVEQDGTVARTLAHRNRLLSISDRTLQAIDHADRDAPRITAKLELARDVLDMKVVGLDAVTLSSSGWWWDSASVTLRVAPVSDPEGTPKGSLVLPFRAQRLLVDGAHVVALGWPVQWDGTARIGWIDLTNPAAPRLVKEASVGRREVSSEGIYQYEYPSIEQALVPAPGFVVVPSWGGRSTRDSWESFSTVSIANVDGSEPRRLVLPGSIVGEPVAAGGLVWVGHYEPIESDDGRGYARYYVDRVDPVAATVATSINVPGTLAGVVVDAAGTTLFTRDFQWNPDGHSVQALAELTVVNDRARLRKYLPVEAYLGRFVQDGRRLYVTTSPWWWGGDTTAVPELRVYGSSAAVPLGELSRTVIQRGQNVTAVKGGFLFLGTGWYGGPWEMYAEGDVAGGMPWYGWGGPSGVTAYSLGDPDHPAYRKFIRTNGWVQGLEVRDQTVLVSSGIYGVQSVFVAR